MVSYYRAFAPKSEAVNYMDYRATLNFLITLANETFILDDGNCIVTVK